MPWSGPVRGVGARDDMRSRTMINWSLDSLFLTAIDFTLITECRSRTKSGLHDLRLTFESDLCWGSSSGSPKLGGVLLPLDPSPWSERMDRGELSPEATQELECRVWWKRCVKGEGVCSVMSASATSSSLGNLTNLCPDPALICRTEQVLYWIEDTETHTDRPYLPGALPLPLL